MFRSQHFLRSFSTIAPAVTFVSLMTSTSQMEGSQQSSSSSSSSTSTNPSDYRIHSPSFSATALKMKPRSIPKSSSITIDSLRLIAGSSNPKLANEISEVIKVPLSPANISRFADGEVSIQINENIRGKDVYIIQSCAAPVNDSIMELLLTVSTCRRASARRIVAVIPYFGYKHHRRQSKLSFKHHSRFLTSSPGDFATMLLELGVDRVIGVDLQRPGQGLEACFFDNNIPVETVLLTDAFARYLGNTEQLIEPVTIIAPNAELYKKGQIFKQELQRHLTKEVKLIPYFAANTDSGQSDVEPLLPAEIEQVNFFPDFIFSLISFLISLDES